MKKQILDIGRALSRAEQKTINGGNLDGGPCRDAYPSMGIGCKCSKHTQCASNYCGPKSAQGNNWWGECATKPVITPA